MRMTFKTILFVSFISLAGVQAANATLFLRSLGGGIDNALYDDALNVTWLRDGNLATSNNFGVTSINSSGTMNWNESTDWIAAMNTANYLGQSNWRRATLGPINSSSFRLTETGNGSTDRGRNISRPGTLYAGSTANEMAHLFYNTLGNVSDYSVTGSFDNGCPGSASCLTNTGLFTNLQSGSYWFGDKSDANRGWRFSFGNGFQYTDLITSDRYVLAALDGDVSAVPVPAAVWLMGSAMIGLFGFGRKKRT